MKKKFLVGDFCFELNYDELITIPENLLRFEVDETRESVYRYNITLVHRLDAIKGNKKAERQDIQIYEEKGFESRLLGIKESREYYALYREVSERAAEVQLKYSQLEGVNFDPFFISLLALEKRMLLYNNLIFHCAYVEHEGEAILFSAPSGGGKSTQAELWNRYRGCRTINGDRALFVKSEMEWNAAGWPICGTSRICLQEKMKIKAVVFLQKGQKNHIVRMAGLNAVQALYSQITVNSWDSNKVNKVFDILVDFMNLVPVFQLTCDISEDAVVCLETILDELKSH